MAGVYVYRPGHLVGSGVLFAVSFDFRDFGNLVTDTYLFATVTPGPHVIKAGGGIPLGIASARLNAEAGRLYFFKTSPGWTQISLVQATEDEGRATVSTLKPSGDNVFEFSEKAGQ